MVDKMKFATYLHPETTLTSRPANEIEFRGHSYPYFSQVRSELERSLSHYPQLALRQVEYSDYLTVHSETYIQKLIAMASGEKVEEFKRYGSLEFSVHFDSFEHCSLAIVNIKRTLDIKICGTKQ